MPAMARTVTDLLGRQVEIPAKPKRIVLGESRMLYTLGLLQPQDPGQHIIGWPSDIQRYDPQSWSQYLAAFPQLGSITSLGSSVNQLNPEKLIQLQPDLVILPRVARRDPNTDQLVTLLTTSHIPVIFVDFRVNLLHNTVPSLRLLGTALNQSAQAEKFIAFYQKHMAAIPQRLASYQGKKPTVMLQLHLGRDEHCCTTAVKGNLGQLLNFAGGDNIATTKVSGVFGEVSPEFLLQANPDRYIATGMLAGNSGQGLLLGPQGSTQLSQQRFLELVKGSPVLNTLPAVSHGHAYQIWQNFYLSPMHIVACEFFAKLLYPELFSDLSPEATLRSIYAQFLPIPYTGYYFGQLTYHKS